MVKKAKSKTFLTQAGQQFDESVLCRIFNFFISFGEVEHSQGDVRLGVEAENCGQCVKVNLGGRQVKFEGHRRSGTHAEITLRQLEQISHY